MSKQTYSIEWTTNAGIYRQKFFPNLRKLKQFEQKEMKFIELPRKYFIFDGTKKEEFIYHGTLLMTKSFILSLLNRF